MESQLITSSRRALIIVIGGCTALIAFGVFSLVGWPGTSIGLLPFGLLMIMLGGSELLLSSLG